MASEQSIDAVQAIDFDILYEKLKDLKNG